MSPQLGKTPQPAPHLPGALRTALGTLWLAGCVFGDGTSPRAVVGLEVQSNASTVPERDATPEPEAAEDAGLDGAAPDAALSGARSDAGTKADASRPAVSAAACQLTVRGCDPVAKTGCLDLFGMQCAVDTDATDTAGRCVFHNGEDAGVAGACQEDALSTTCAPGEACTAGVCHTLCKCDDDCGAGSCCVDPVLKPAGSALKLCGACP